MTSDRLARDYLRRARARRRALDTLMEAEAFADVVREAQERSHAFYGDEEAMVGASELFKVEDGRRALTLVDRVFSLYVRILGEP